MDETQKWVDVLFTLVGVCFSALIAWGFKQMEALRQDYLSLHHTLNETATSIRGDLADLRSDIPQHYVSTAMLAELVSKRIDRLEHKLDETLHLMQQQLLKE
jgi:hypothetical protein